MRKVFHLFYSVDKKLFKKLPGEAGNVPLVPSINIWFLSFTELIDDDIADDVSCGKVIYESHGFSAWDTWVTHCEKADLESYISDCGI